MAAGTGMAFEDLSVGQTATFEKTIGEAEVHAFAEASGDDNPVHLDADYAAATPFKGRIAHGMLTGSLVSAILGTRLPGPGTIYLSQTLKFRAPVPLGSTVVATVEVTALDPAKRRATLRTVCAVDGKPVVEGEAVVMVPARAAAPAP